MRLQKRQSKVFNRAALGLLACIIIPSEMAISAANLASKDASVSIWTAQEKQQLLSLSAHHLPEIKEDISNQYQNNKQAIVLGAKLFFDARLSDSGTISCSVCHQPNREFSDGLRVASGLEQGKRNTPSILGGSHQKWFFWDGRKDSLWAQALEPFEDATEHNLSRTKLLKIILEDPSYKGLYNAVFTDAPSDAELDSWPENASPKRDLEGLKAWKSLEKNTRKKINRAFSNIGKAIAAYESTLLFQTSRFDQYLDDLRKNKPSSHLSESEVSGLKVFIGKGQTFEVWEPKAFEKYAANARKEALAKRGALRLGAKKDD